MFVQSCQKKKSDIRILTPPPKVKKKLSPPLFVGQYRYFSLAFWTFDAGVSVGIFCSKTFLMPIMIRSWQTRGRFKRHAKSSLFGGAHCRYFGHLRIPVAERRNCRMSNYFLSVA
jgi:hypothetical protein